MPIDISNNKIYKINYDEMYKEVGALHLFNDSKIQSVYLNKWIEVLKQADDMSIKAYNDSSLRKNIIKENLEAPEIFQIQLIHNANTIYLHFRVSRILENIKRSGITEREAIEIPAEDFIKKNSYIIWTKTSDNVKMKKEPIVMVPLKTGLYHKMVVIDGNHRITDCINNRKKHVKAYQIDGSGLVHNDLFATAFDKMMYIFQNELIEVGTYTKMDDISALELIEKVFFSTGELLRYC